MSLKKLRGTSLIEILITLVVFAAISASSYLTAKTLFQKARDSKRKADLEKIKLALYDYFFDTNCFPESLPNCGEKLTQNNHTYLDNFPCDYQEIPFVYQTENEDCRRWFKVFTNLENTKDPAIDKLGCRLGCGPNCAYNYGLGSSNILIREGCVVTYACTPSGNCAEFEDPQASQCPKIYENNPSCNGGCSTRANRCHDERGKK
jgi:type II secretory pathway pseudopilin PulG